ncbi:MAG: DUF4062 domain-containing protein [Bacteroidetes bacterium]|nr:DUF4062 domain-containing protein [Bacteroidota bacterium]
MKEKPVVMVSSTVNDLPDYRSMVKDACLRASTFPNMMEHLSAWDADAIDISLSMVDKSDIYIGIFAHKYGYVPQGHKISITEMEYNRAVKRKIPRLIFIIDDKVPVLPSDFEKGLPAEKLDALKAKLTKEQVVAFFKSPEDLRGLVVDSLNKLKDKLQKDQIGEIDPGELWAKKLHAHSDIPPKPEAFVAHPYTLLQVKGLIGRKQELEILTDWITRPYYQGINIFNIVAIGGMGKSALTWTWFHEVAPQENDWDGRVWWSFYETDATFDKFIIQTLVYVSGMTEEEVKKLPSPDRQAKLFYFLNTQPYLIVLDGLERILVAYARPDAAYLDDDTALDDMTSNWVAGAMGLPESGAKSFVGKHRLRKTTDPRIGRFLQQLSQVQKSKILVSTRLYPADLQTSFGEFHPGCGALFLPGLSDRDALELWRAYKAKGSREAMLPVFRSFDKHPLMLQLLASEVAEYRSAPGDFDAWKEANPDFNVFGLPLVQVQSHVLSYALRGLTQAELRTLQVIAGFHMPASIETLKALLIQTEEEKEKRFHSTADLDKALTTLEDKGLLGWDRKVNRYDLHPIVRGVVWSHLDIDRQYEIHGSLRSHFEAMPVIKHTDVESLEDLRPAIELFHSLMEMKLYWEASGVFYNRLNKATLYRLSANQLRVELLERFFTKGIEELPALNSKDWQAWILGALATGYHFSGLPGKAIPLYERDEEICHAERDEKNQAIVLANLSDNLRLTGKLYRAEKTVKKGLILDRKIQDNYANTNSIAYLGQALAYRGEYQKAQKALEFKIKLSVKNNRKQAECVDKAYLSQVFLLNGQYLQSRDFADQAWELAAVRRLERDFIRAALFQGLIALRSGNIQKADERLNYSLRKIRTVQVIDEELQILNALAEFHHKKNEPEKAREYLEEIWDRAEQGPYPLFHADALNILAQIEIAAGNHKAAITSATQAYQKAWCDGPPYAYHYGLEKAKGLLKELGAEEPEMPPFDPSKFEPMPEVEIEPPEEEENPDV